MTLALPLAMTLASPQFIAIILGSFFLIAALINFLRGRLADLKRRNQLNAQAQGGTEDSPVQLNNPFAEETPEPEPAPKAATEQAPAADAPVANVPTDSAPTGDRYVWE